MANQTPPLMGLELATPTLLPNYYRRRKCQLRYCSLALCTWLCATLFWVMVKDVSCIDLIFWTCSSWFHDMLLLSEQTYNVFRFLLQVIDMQHLYKNQLQNYVQKRNLSLPAYSCEREGPPHASRFRCKVTIDGHTYESPEFFSTLKDAEHAAAKVALKSLSPDEAKEASVLYHFFVYLFSLSVGCVSVLFFSFFFF